MYKYTTQIIHMNTYIKMNITIKNIVISLCLTNAFMASTPFATDKDITDNHLNTSKAAPYKSYGAFVQNIANQTTELVNDLKKISNTALNHKASLENLFEKMLHATLYGYEEKTDSKASFKLDISGKPVSINDNRIKNIFRICENAAIYASTLKRAGIISNDEDILLESCWKNTVPYRHVHVSDSLKEFARLQHLMLRRITFSYYTKLCKDNEGNPVLDTNYQQPLFRKNIIKFLPQFCTRDAGGAIDKEHRENIYKDWEKTDEATKVALGYLGLISLDPNTNPEIPPAEKYFSPIQNNCVADILRNITKKLHRKDQLNLITVNKSIRNHAKKFFYQGNWHKFYPSDIIPGDCHYRSVCLDNFFNTVIEHKYKANIEIEMMYYPILKEIQGIKEIDIQDFVQSIKIDTKFCFKPTPKMSFEGIFEDFLSSVLAPKVVSLSLLMHRYTNMDNLVSLTNIRKLILHIYQQIDLTPLKELKKLKKLKIVRSDFVIHTYPGYPVPGNLEKLDGLHELKSLTFFSIFSKNITPEVLTSIAELKELEELDIGTQKLDETRIYDVEGLNNLISCVALKKLKRLNIAGSKVSDLKSLKALTSLTDIDIRKTPVASNNSEIETFQAEHPNCKIMK